MILASGAPARAPFLGSAVLTAAASALLVACGGGGGDGGGGTIPTPAASSSPSPTPPATPTPEPQPTTPIARTLAPGAELAPTLAAPQPDSTALTGDDKQGIYVSLTGVGLISSAGRLMYKDFGRWVFGWLDVSGTNWTFRSPTISVSTVPDSYLEFVTGSGMFESKKAMTGEYYINGGTKRDWGPLSYSDSNALAVQQKDMAGSWSTTNSTGYGMTFEVDADGNLTGSTTGVQIGECNLTGTLLQTEPSTSRNMFDLKMKATNSATRPTDKACTLQQANEYDGLAAVYMAPVSSYPEEGAYRTLIFHAATPTGGILTNNLRKR